MRGRWGAHGLGRRGQAVADGREEEQVLVQQLQVLRTVVKLALVLALHRRLNQQLVLFKCLSCRAVCSFFSLRVQ